MPAPDANATAAGRGPNPASAGSAGQLGKSPRRSASAIKARRSRWRASIARLMNLLDGACTSPSKGGLVSAAVPRPAKPVAPGPRPLLLGHWLGGRPGPAWPRTCPRCSNHAGCCASASTASRRARSSSGSVTASARSSTRSTSVSAAARASTRSRRLSAAGAALRAAPPNRCPALRGVGGNWLARPASPRSAANVRQQEIHGLHLLLELAPGKQQARALDQVIGLASCAAQGRHIGLHAALGGYSGRDRARRRG